MLAHSASIGGMFRIVSIRHSATCAAESGASAKPILSGAASPSSDLSTPGAIASGRADCERMRGAIAPAPQAAEPRSAAPLEQAVLDLMLLQPLTNVRKRV